MYSCLGWNIFSEFGLKLVRHFQNLPMSLYFPTKFKCQTSFSPNSRAKCQLYYIKIEHDIVKLILIKIKYLIINMFAKLKIKNRT